MKVLRSLGVFGVRCAAVLLLLSSAPSVTRSAPARAETVQTERAQVDRCEDATRWKAVGKPYGPVEISAGPYGAKEGTNCVRMVFPNSGVAYVTCHPKVAWGDNDRLAFWLKAEGPARGKRRLRLQSDSEDGVFGINVFIDLDFKGWTRVSLDRDDFEFVPRKHAEAPDWSKIRTLKFGQTGSQGMATIYIDDIRYERNRKRKTGNPPAQIVVNSCDSIEGWTAKSLALRAIPKQAIEGAAALEVGYTGVMRGEIATKLPSAAPGPGHVLTLHLRGAGIHAKATLTVAFRTRAGSRFVSDISIRDFEMRQRVVFPGDFRQAPGPDGSPPRWDDVDELAFIVGCGDATESGAVIIDDIRFERVSPGKKRRRPDKKFYWWDGGYDRFAMMHVVHADWPHLETDPRPAVLKFSEFLLSPLMPYTIFLHNDGTYAGFKVTITDYKTEVLRILEIDSQGQSIIRRELRAPARTGSYIFNVDCLDASGRAVATYQTGITVLAKRLSEPSGVWGLHAFIGSKGRHWPHHEQVMRMLQETGVMVIRERVGFRKWSPRQMEAARSGPQVRVLTMARKMGMKTAVSVYLDHQKHLWVDGRYVRGIAPGKESEAIATMSSVARTFKGLVDWWEIGNEGNSGLVDPYIPTLAACYKAVKAADPDAGVIMGGCHVLNRPKAWQVRAWEIEKQTGAALQDALATHLYPDPSALEDSMRAWVRLLGDALVDKGMVMTEGGMETVTYRTHALLKKGVEPDPRAGEPTSQDWYLRYAPIILGEHLAMGAELKGVCFFLAMGAVGDWMWEPRYGGVDLRGSASGHFVAQWDSREITMGRPMAYTHNTIARLLTHEVKRTDLPLIYDKSRGKVEYYAFARPGEIVVPMWVGVRAGSRSDRIEVRFKSPPSVGLVLSADVDGNERIVVPDDGVLTVWLEKGRPQYVRLLDGKYRNGVFLNAAKDGTIRADAKIVAGIPARHRRIAVGISRDRNLPVVSDVVPLPGTPMVLYSKPQNTVYLVGQSDADVARADSVLRSILTSR